MPLVSPFFHFPKPPLDSNTQVYRERNCLPALVEPSLRPYRPTLQVLSSIAQSVFVNNKQLLDEVFVIFEQIKV